MKSKNTAGDPKPPRLAPELRHVVSAGSWRDKQKRSVDETLTDCGRRRGERDSSICAVGH